MSVLFFFPTLMLLGSGCLPIWYAAVPAESIKVDCGIFFLKFLEPMENDKYYPSKP
jgi:hypothetical protein